MALIGIGVLRGMFVTLREFVGTYPAGRALLRLLGQPRTNGLFTIEYPDQKQQHAERFRYFPFLVYDGTPDNLRCVACKICEQECPPACIHIIGPAKDAQGRPLKVNGRLYPVEFDIDTSVCMSCRICVDVCPFDAIEMDNQYKLSSSDRFEPLVFDKQQLLKSADYLKEIKPTEHATVEQRLAPKRAKAAAAETKTAPSANPPPSAP